VYDKGYNGHYNACVLYHRTPENSFPRSKLAENLISRNGEEKVRTDLLDIGVGEVIHKKMNSSQTEALIVRRQSPLQFFIIDQTTSILIRHLKACNDAWIGAGREC